jgi:hypothetical protein
LERRVHLHASPPFPHARITERDGQSQNQIMRIGDRACGDSNNGQGKIIMAFHVGQKVVCVDAIPCAGRARALRALLGEIYTVRSVQNECDHVTALFEELETVSLMDATGYKIEPFPPHR